MKFAFKFSNLCGAVYKQGSIAFSADGNCILSPVGNRISQFDLKNNKSLTFPFENDKNIYRFTVSPDGVLMITVDEEGRSLLINLQHRIVLHHFNFKAKIYDIKFSPNGKYVAVTNNKSVHLWYAPGRYQDFAPFHIYRKFPGQYDDARCIDWSDNSQFFAVGSRDMSCRVYSVSVIKGYRYVNLLGHRSTVIACFFEQQSLNLYTISKDGAVIVWEANMSLEQIAEMVTAQKDNSGQGEDSMELESMSLEEEEEEEVEDGEEVTLEPSSDEDNDEDTQLPIAKKQRPMNIITWRKVTKHLYSQERARVTCATVHKPTKILITGFTNGIFTIHEMPDFNHIHTLSISEHRITSVAINNTGEWLGFASSTLGQLLVWEWQSETYVLKQQSHYYDMNVMCYSPDGQVIATGGDDGKVKLWNTSSGFCFVTFSEHISAVSSVLFNSVGKVVVSASFDGTVRAYDLHRYRNFRTFASPRPVQFTCLALDPSGEIVSAGSHDTFEIFIWSIQTGRLLEILTGHEGPVSSLSFSPTRSILASSSWDKTVKLWDVFESKGNVETFMHTTDVLTLTYRPDGCQVAVATLDGQISFWDVQSSVQVGSIEGRTDLDVGRRSTDRVTAKHLSTSAHFSSLCYTADGQSLLAGGRSKYVCIYDVEHQVLLKKFQTSHNQAFDGMKRILNSRFMSEAGPLDLISDDERDSDTEQHFIPLPGVHKGDFSSRKTHPEIRTKCLQFSPTGRAWSAVTTEGLLIYTLDTGILFDPFDLTTDVTPDAIQLALKEHEYIQALVMSLRLNEYPLIIETLETIPLIDVELVLQGLSQVYIERLLPVLSERLDHSPHLQYYLQWCTKLLCLHTETLKQNSLSLQSLITDLQKSIIQRQTDIGKLCDSNTYSLQYLLQIMEFKQTEERTLTTTESAVLSN